MANTTMQLDSLPYEEYRSFKERHYLAFLNPSQFVEARKARGYTQEQLAELANVTRSVVANAETGRSLSKEEAFKIWKVLSVGVANQFMRHLYREKLERIEGLMRTIQAEVRSMKAELLED